MFWACFPGRNVGTTMCSWLWIISQNDLRHTRYQTRSQHSSHVRARVLHTVDLVFDAPSEPELPSKPGMDYFFRLWGRLRCTHKLTRDTLAKTKLKQRRAYDVHAHGWHFGVGEHVWMFMRIAPPEKKGPSPSHVALGGAMHTVEAPFRRDLPGMSNWTFAGGCASPASTLQATGSDPEGLVGARRAASFYSNAAVVGRGCPRCHRHLPPRLRDCFLG